MVLLSSTVYMHTIAFVFFRPLRFYPSLCPPFLPTRHLPSPFPFCYDTFFTASSLSLELFSLPFPTSFSLLSLVPFSFSPCLLSVLFPSSLSLPLYVPGYFYRIRPSHPARELQIWLFLSFKRRYNRAGKSAPIINDDAAPLRYDNSPEYEMLPYPSPRFCMHYPAPA